MRNRSSKPHSRDVDENVMAKRIVDQIIQETEDVVTSREKNPAAVSLGRLGGLKGGHARAKKLTPETRSLIAKKAANARWNKIKT